MSYTRNQSYAPQRQSTANAFQQQKQQRQPPWQQLDETGHLTASHGQQGTNGYPDNVSIGSSASAPRAYAARQSRQMSIAGGDRGTDLDWAHYASADRYDTAVAPMETYLPDDGYPPDEGYDIDAISDADDYRLVDVVSFTDAPEKVMCPYCLCQVVTEPVYAIGFMQILFGTFICLFGGVLGCCLLPCFCKCLLDVVHVCPECAKAVGRCRRI